MKCVVSPLQAVVQEADQRLAELKKATYEFDRDVLRGSVNPVGPCLRFPYYYYCMLPLLQRTKRIMAEKVVKYFEDRVKSRVNTIYTITNYQLGRYVPITGLTGRKVAFKEFVIESEAKKASDSTQKGH